MLKALIATMKTFKGIAEAANWMKFQLPGATCKVASTSTNPKKVSHTFWMRAINVSKPTRGCDQLWVVRFNSVSSGRAALLASRAEAVLQKRMAAADARNARATAHRQLQKDAAEALLQKRKAGAAARNARATADRQLQKDAAEAANARRKARSEAHVQRLADLSKQAAARLQEVIQRSQTFSSISDIMEHFKSCGTGVSAVLIGPEARMGKFDIIKKFFREHMGVKVSGPNGERVVKFSKVKVGRKVFRNAF